MLSRSLSDCESLTLTVVDNDNDNDKKKKKTKTKTMWVIKWFWDLVTQLTLPDKWQFDKDLFPMGLAVQRGVISWGEDPSSCDVLSPYIMPPSSTPLRSAHCYYHHHHYRHSVLISKKKHLFHLSSFCLFTPQTFKSFISLCISIFTFLPSPSSIASEMRRMRNEI